MVRKGFVAMAEKLDFVQVIGDAANGRQVTTFKWYTGRCGITDIEMPVMNGLTQQYLLLKLPVCGKTIILTMLNDKELVQEAIEKSWVSCLRTHRQANLRDAMQKSGRRGKLFSAAR